MKWITNILQSPTVNAVDKAKVDIAKIARTRGYNILSIFRYSATGESDEAMHSRVDGITAGVAAGDIVLYQYPSYISIRFDLFFINHMIARGAKIVLFIHDIEYMRKGISKTFNEIEILNRCDALIVHNSHMEKKLRVFGVKIPMISNYIFDFLQEETYKNNDFNREVVLAGSLLKSDYLTKWNYKTRIIAFGNHDGLKLSDTVDYRGAVAQEELSEKLPNCFGLSWDSTEGFKEYTKYNNPYKLSMYLAMGLPVIVWNRSAIASFVVNNNLGYAIGDLSKLDGLMSELSDGQILNTRNNVRKFGALLRQGFFTKKALLRTEQQLSYGSIEYDSEIVR